MRPFARRSLVAAAIGAFSLLGSVQSHAQSLQLDAPVFKQLYDAAVAAGEDELVYYTASRDEEAKKLSEIWKANFPKITLTLVGKQAPAVITQVEAERAAGHLHADLVTITQPYIADVWKKKGYYAPYKVSNFDKIMPEYADPDGAFYSSGVYLLTVAYNSKAYPDASKLPHTLADLLDPQYKGKIIIADPATSGNSLTYFMSLIQSGKVDWSYFEKLRAQDVMFVRGASEATRSLASGERVISPIIASFNALLAKQSGQALDFYGFDDGAQVAEQPSGIMTGAKHLNAAKLMLELLTSASAQEQLSGVGKYWPTNVDAKLVDGMPPIASLHPVKLTMGNADDKDIRDFLDHFNAALGRE
jgi:iron(III) transport system substrate-binding protein